MRWDLSYRVTRANACGACLLPWRGDPHGSKHRLDAFARVFSNFYFQVRETMDWAGMVTVKLWVASSMVALVASDFLLLITKA